MLKYDRRTSRGGDFFLGGGSRVATSGETGSRGRNPDPHKKKKYEWARGKLKKTPPAQLQKKERGERIQVGKSLGKNNGGNSNGNAQDVAHRHIKQQKNAQSRRVL